jgi:hypothetical protein
VALYQETYLILSQIYIFTLLFYPKMKNTVTDKEDQDKIWNSIIRQFEFITGTQISNNFIVLMALSESKESMSTTQLSEIISSRSK